MLFEQRFGQTYFISLVERTSRFTVLLKNPSKRTKPVMGKVIRAIRDLPIAARKSIIFDRGTEFVSWPHLQGRDRDTDVVLRSLSALAKGHRGEHQPGASQIAAPQARSDGDLRS